LAARQPWHTACSALPTMQQTKSSTPQQTSAWGSDILSGFLVFLIALPLCLGIAMASSFPPVAGVITAIVGGMLTTFFGSARLTIKGPAAGLIVIGLGAVTELGNGDALLGYRLALATIVVAAVFQILFSLVRAGALGDFFPASVVHGMLAAIGVIICSKQIHTALGVTPEKGGPLSLLAQVPTSIGKANPEVALIGILSLVVLFGWALLPAAVRKVPAQIVVVGMALVLGARFDLGHEHHYQFQGHDFVVGPKFLVDLPGSLLSAVTFPDFSQILSGTSIKYIVMFALVGTIESLLSTKAVDALDPEKRRSDLDKDLLAVGVGNLIAGMIGGLPMISEIVRSSANIANGAKTKFANFFHGLFLLLFVSSVPWLLARIPMAALAAMLIYTGFRLASPREFAKTWRIGREQMVIFASTLVVTVATDLLLGVFAGIVVKILLHWANGMPLRNVFRPAVQQQRVGDSITLKVGHAAVFSNYLTIKRHLGAIPASQRRVVIDLDGTRLVDHTVMEKLHELQGEWAREGRELVVAGLERHRSVSAHPLAARRKSTTVSFERAVQ
jgi:MFS superfamily sulfate permease-like transporter